MSLLEFARGPAFQAAVAILVFGVFWRLLGVLTLRWGQRQTEPRASAAAGGVRTVFSRFWPRRGLSRNVRTGRFLGYLSHIGLALVVFGGVYHIETIHGVLGVAWPALPGSLISVAAVIALGAFLGLLGRRLMHPTVRFLSTWEDYFSWAVAVLPLVTGLLAGAGLGLDYATLLAIHILSAELLLIWLPFGKLFHGISFVPSRAFTGANYGRRGVKI